MEKQDFNIKQYPKSKNNFQCLGPCYYPGSTVLHPTLLRSTRNDLYPFCPVDPWENIDAATGKSEKLTHDICLNPTEKEYISNKELELNILTPYIDFNLEKFLKIYYNIFSFEESIDWIDKNNHVPLETKIRIINASLRAFGENVDIFDNRFADFFVNFIKARKIKQLYIQIAKYIGFDEKKKEIFLIEDTKNPLKNGEYCVERINYVIRTFFDKSDTTKFLIRYFKYRKEHWEDIKDHLYNMASDFLAYILNKISVTIQK